MILVLVDIVVEVNFLVFTLGGGFKSLRGRTGECGSGLALMVESPVLPLAENPSSCTVIQIYQKLSLQLLRAYEL